MSISNRLSLLRRDTYFRHNVTFWAASLLVAFVNYLYYPILGRFTGPADFGEIQTIISIFMQMAVFFQVLSLIGVGIITKYESEEKRTEITDEMTRLALYVSVVLLIVLAVFSPALKGFFHFRTVSPFLALACSLLISVPLAFSNSYLQGHKRFWTLASVNLLLSALRIVFAVILVVLGFRTMGAVVGLIFAQLLALAYSLKKGSGIRNFVVNHLRIQKLRLALVRDELPFAGMVLATSLTTNLLLSLDILVVKHYFPPREAGLYTGISIIANIVYFATGPIASVLVPSIKLGQPRAESFRLLKRSAFLLLPIGGVITLCFILFPHLIVTIMLGSKFAVYASYLRGLTVALFLLSISNLLIYYHISLRHYLIAPIVAFGLLVAIVLLQIRHATMGLIVGDLVYSSIVILFLLCCLPLFYGRKYAAR